MLGQIKGSFQMMVLSPNFQENKLKDEVSYWLKTKLRREFDSANEKALAFVDAGQMTPQQLLKKYSL